MTATTEVVRALSASEARSIRRFELRKRVWLWLALLCFILLVPFTIGIAFADARRGDYLATLLPPAIVYSVYLCMSLVAKSGRPRGVVTGMPVHLLTGEYRQAGQPDGHDLLGGLAIEFPRRALRARLPHGATVAAEVLLGRTALVLSVRRCEPRHLASLPARLLLHVPTSRARLRFLRGRDSESPAGEDDPSGPPSGGGA